MSRPAILVFARHPGSERSKTRLEPAVGVAGARDLHRAFLADTLTAVRASGALVLLAHSAGPPFAEAEFADERFEQRGDSFGVRLDGALADARERLGPDVPFAVIGSDTPHLGARSMAATLESLASHDAVLGPSPRGGFYTLGFRGDPLPIADAFDAPDECAAVLHRLREARRSVATLEPFWDIDTPEDLQRLRALLASSDGPELSATRTALGI